MSLHRESDPASVAVGTTSEMMAGSSFGLFWARASPARVDLC